MDRHHVAPRPTIESLLIDLIALIRAHPTHDDVARRLLHAIDHRSEELHRLLVLINRKENINIMLNQAETDAINQLSTDIDAALTAATSHDEALQAVIDGLQAQLDALNASGTDADQAQIDALTQSVADLQAALDSHSTEVVAALTGLDEHVVSLTPTPTTTTTPASEPMPEPTPEEPA